MNRIKQMALSNADGCGMNCTWSIVSREGDNRRNLSCSCCWVEVLALPGARAVTECACACTCLLPLASGHLPPICAATQARSCPPTGSGDPPTDGHRDTVGRGPWHGIRTLGGGPFHGCVQSLGTRRKERSPQSGCHVHGSPPAMPFDAARAFSEPMTAGVSRLAKLVSHRVAFVLSYVISPVTSR